MRLFQIDGLFIFLLIRMDKLWQTWVRSEVFSISYLLFSPALFLYIFQVNLILIADKVHIFWEGHKILRNLHQLFDWQYIGQIIDGYFAKCCGLLRIYELYLWLPSINKSSTDCIQFEFCCFSEQVIAKVFYLVKTLRFVLFMALLHFYNYPYFSTTCIRRYINFS